MGAAARGNRRFGSALVGVPAANCQPGSRGRQSAGRHPAQSPDTARTAVPESIKATVPDVSKLKTELTDTFSKLTETLTSVKDAQSAETALPTLQELEGKLDVVKTTMKDLGAAGKATISTVVKAAEGKLRDLIEKVLAIPGVGEKIKAVADSIKTKLTDLSA